jgi:hypothetical protein
MAGVVGRRARRGLEDTDRRFGAVLAVYGRTTREHDGKDGDQNRTRRPKRPTIKRRGGHPHNRSDARVVNSLYSRDGLPASLTSWAVSRKAAAGTIALAVAVALGHVSPAICRADPAVAAKDFSKPAIVIHPLGYGHNPTARCARLCAVRADGSGRRTALPAVADHRDRRQPAKRQHGSRTDAKYADAPWVPSQPNHRGGQGQ